MAEAMGQTGKVSKDETKIARNEKKFQDSGTRLKTLHVESYRMMR